MHIIEILGGVEADTDVVQAVSFSGDVIAKHRSLFRNASESGMPEFDCMYVYIAKLCLLWKPESSPRLFVEHIDVYRRVQSSR